MNPNSIGLLLILTGIAFIICRSMGIPLGRLPGDIVIERNGSTFMFPIASMILLSIILSIVRNLVAK